MEQILLGDTCIFCGELWETGGVIFSEYTFYPHIFRERLRAVHTEEEDALRDFGTHALYLHKSLTCLIDGSLSNSGQVGLTGSHTFSGIADILSAEAASQVGEAVGSFRSELGSCGEIPVIVFTETVDDAFDAGNIVILGNNEGNEAFPAILFQQADTAGESAGFFEGIVIGEQFFESGIVGGEIEIVGPFAEEILFRGIMENELPFSCLRYGEPIIKEAAGISTLVDRIDFFPAEGLTAVEGLIEVEVRFRNDNIIAFDRILHNKLLYS